MIKINFITLEITRKNFHYSLHSFDRSNVNNWKSPSCGCEIMIKFRKHFKRKIIKA